MSLILPDKLYFDIIDFPQTVDMLYEIFSKDFIKTKTTFLGKYVVFDNRIVSNLVRNFDSEKSHISIMLR